MLELKNYAMTISICKHAEADKDQVVFITGYPKAYDIYHFVQGKVNDDMRQFVSDLAVTLGVHIGISEKSVGKDIGE